MRSLSLTPSTSASISRHTVSCNILTGRIPVTSTRQRADSSLKELSRSWLRVFLSGCGEKREDSETAVVGGGQSGVYSSSSLPVLHRSKRQMQSWPSSFMTLSVNVKWSWRGGASGGTELPPPCRLPQDPRRFDLKRSMKEPVWMEGRVPPRVIAGRADLP